jgi:chemotaxis protein histidine kinase CheA
VETDGIEKNNVRVDTREIRRLMRKVQEPTAFQLSLSEIRENLRTAINDWKNHKKHQIELREQFELRMDEQRAKKFGTSSAT